MIVVSLLSSKKSASNVSAAWRPSHYSGHCHHASYWLVVGPSAFFQYCFFTPPYIIFSQFYCRDISHIVHYALGVKGWPGSPFQSPFLAPPGLLPTDLLTSHLMESTVVPIYYTTILKVSQITSNHQIGHTGCFDILKPDILRNYDCFSFFLA